MVAVGTVLANLPWGEIADRAPRLLARATRFVRSFKSSTEKGAGLALAANAQNGGIEEAVSVLEGSVKNLEADLQKAALLIEEMAESHASMARELKRAYIALIPTVVVAVGALIIALFSLFR